MNRWRLHLDPRNWSITVKLTVALLTAALLPMLVIAWLTLSRGADELRAKGYRTVQTLAEVIAGRVDQLLTDTEHNASQLAGGREIGIFLLSTPEERAGQQARIEESLAGVLGSNPDFESVLLVDSNGHTVAAQQRLGVPSLAEGIFPGHTYVEAVLGGLPYTDVRVSPSTHKLSVYFAAPVRSAGRQIIGAAIIQMQGESLYRIMNKYYNPVAGRYPFLIDSDGVIFSHPDDTWRYRSLRPLDPIAQIQNGRRFASNGCTDPPSLGNCGIQSLGIPALADAMLGATERGYVLYHSPVDGSSQLVAFAPVQRLHWVAAVSIPEQQFIAPITQLEQQTVVASLIIGLLTIAAAVLLAHTIAQPIGTLAMAAREIEQDRPFELATLAGVMRLGDEIGHLARAFSAMVLSLQERMAELRTIYEIGNRINSSIELDQTLRFILDSIRMIAPFDSARICLYDAEHDHLDLAAWADRNRTGTTVDYEPHFGFIKHMAETRAGLLLPNIRSFAEAQPDVDYGWDLVQPNSYVGVPLWAGDQMIGAIEMISSRVDGFTRDDLRMLEYISVQASVAVQNSQQVQIRENRLKQQIRELRIEIDEVKRARSVREIVNSDSFQRLRERAQDLRARNKRMMTASMEAVEIPAEREP